MLRKIPKPSRFSDYFHRGTVIACFAVTLAGTILMSETAARYYFQVRPARKRELVEEAKVEEIQ